MDVEASVNEFFFGLVSFCLISKSVHPDLVHNRLNLGRHLEFLWLQNACLDVALLFRPLFVASRVELGKLVGDGLDTVFACHDALLDKHLGLEEKVKVVAPKPSGCLALGTDVENARIALTKVKENDVVADKCIVHNLDLVLEIRQVRLLGNLLPVLLANGRVAIHHFTRREIDPLVDRSFVRVLGKIREH